MKIPARFCWLPLIIGSAFLPLSARAVDVPDWAQPGSATHKQVPPPPDFHRPTVTVEEPIGVFEGQSDIGGPLLPGSSHYGNDTKSYTINSASYNIWYTRDEFRFLWKKMSGDVSLAADIVYPNPHGYDDRKAVLIVRQDLEDDSKEAMVALHGAGLIHLAERPEKGANIKEAHRIVAGAGFADKAPGHVVRLAKRLGVEKRGSSFQLFVSFDGEPLHAVGPAMTLAFDGPFYVGIGFCSHVPDKLDTAVLSRVVLENTAGKVR